MNKNYFKLFIITVVLMPIATYLLCDTFDAGGGLRWLAGLITAVMVVTTFVFAVDPKGASIEEGDVLTPAFKRFRGWLVFLFLLSLIPYQQPKTFWNNSVNLYGSYVQKCQQREGFYDKMYKTYSQKKEIGYINYNQFKEISTIIMENKKDGAQLAWKWLSEQKVIPFEEFTSLWKDLSSFIQSQREGYYNLETECQNLANQNNIYLRSFPNNVYNVVLRRPYANYKYGFTSDKTEEVFRTGKENLKITE